MKYHYKRFERGAFRPIIKPIIPVKVGYNSREIEQEVLVDSGADISLFDAAVGEYLGIPIEEGEASTILGVTSKEPAPIYFHPITMTVGGKEYATSAAFMPGYANFYGIAGQVGFFNIFIVKFDYVKEIIEITPRRMK